MSSKEELLMRRYVMLFTPALVLLFPSGMTFAQAGGAIKAATTSALTTQTTEQLLAPVVKQAVLRGSLIGLTPATIQGLINPAAKASAEPKNTLSKPVSATNKSAQKTVVLDKAALDKKINSALEKQAASVNLDMLRGELSRQGFATDGYYIKAQTNEALAKLRQIRKEVSLQPEAAFETESLESFRPVGDPNTLITLPVGYRLDLLSYRTRGTLENRYAGLRVESNAQGDETIKSMLSTGYPNQGSNGLLVDKTDNGLSIFMSDTQKIGWFDPRGPFKDVQFPLAQLYSQWELRYPAQYGPLANQSPIPHTVLVINHQEANSVPFKPEYSSKVDEVLMLLQVKGELKWCDVQLTPEGKFKVTPHTLVQMDF